MCGSSSIDSKGKASAEADMTGGSKVLMRPPAWELG